MQAMEELLKIDSLSEGAFIWTDFQRDGQGQDGNHWESEPGKNILLTQLFYPGFLDPSRQFLLSQMASLALHQLISNLLPDRGVHIKWPNDLYVGHRKMAGILIRHSLKGNLLERSLIGIGLNVNQCTFSSAIPNPVSLRQLTGTAFNREAILDDLVTRIQSLYSALATGSYDRMEQQYRDCLYRLDQPGYYHIGGSTVQGFIRGVDEQGSLLLEAEGRVKAYGMKEVIYLPEDPDTDQLHL